MNPDQQYDGLQYYVQSPARIQVTTADITNLQTFHPDYLGTDNGIYRYQPYCTYNQNGAYVVAQPAVYSDFSNPDIFNVVPQQPLSQANPPIISSQPNNPNILDTKKEKNPDKDGQFLQNF